MNGGEHKYQKSGDSVKAAQQTFQFDDGGSNPTSPHQFFIKEISVSMALRLNKLWHSRLPKLSRSTTNNLGLCYGFFINDTCYAVAIWSSPINYHYNNTGTLELRRFAIKGGCPPNTASWGISIMTKLIHKKWPEIVKLISYQDTVVHKGTIYKASNWTAIKETEKPTWSKAKSRKRNKEVAIGIKIRWEYDYPTHSPMIIQKRFNNLASLGFNNSEFRGGV